MPFGPIIVGVWAFQGYYWGGLQSGPSVEYQASGGYFAVAYTQQVGNDGPVSVEIDVINPSNTVSESYNVSGYWEPSITTLQSFGFLVTDVALATRTISPTTSTASSGFMIEDRPGRLILAMRPSAVAVVRTGGSSPRARSPGPVLCHRSAP